MLKENPKQTHSNEQTSAYSPGLNELAQILAKGREILVHTGDIPTEKPEWFDERKFKAGQQLVEKYSAGVLLAHLMSLVMLLFSPSVLKPLIFTGKSETPKKSYSRYIATSVHVMSWYRGDIWKEGSRARESLRQVRKYHSDAALKMNSTKTKPRVDQVDISQCGPCLDGGQPLRHSIEKDFSSVINCPFLEAGLVTTDVVSWSPKNYPMYFSQADMAGTQFAFMGLIVAYPEKFGLGKATVEEMEGFIHFWRCIGYLLGIEDHINFCRHDNLRETRAWTFDFLELFVKPLMKLSISPEFEHMGRAVALGATHYLPCTYESIYLFICWVIELPVKDIKSFSFWDRFLFNLMSFLYSWVGNTRLGNLWLNRMGLSAVNQIVNPSKNAFNYNPPPVPGLRELWINP